MGDANATFRAACVALYDGSSDAVRRREADQWITGFQKQAEAFGVVDGILTASDDEVSLELQFLAAKTFHTKVRYDYYDQVPAMERMGLKNKLLSHLERHFSCSNSRKHAVTTQLCMAVAALVIQMEEWDNAIKDLAGHFGRDVGSSQCLIELLQIIPEELCSAVYNISAVRRARLMGEMHECSSDVLGFLCRCGGASNNDQHVHMKILKCLRAWVSIVDIPGEVLVSSELINGLFGVLSNPSELFDVAVSVLTSVLRSCQDLDIPENVTVLKSLAPRIFGLRSAFMRAINEEDEEYAIGLCKIFTDLADVHLPVLISSQEVDRETMLNLVLAGANHPSFDVACNTWFFWNSFVDEFGKIQNNKDFQQALELYLPLMKLLMKSCLAHLRLPKDHANPLTVNTKTLDTEFYHNRKDIQDLLISLCRLVDTNKILTMISGSLQEAIVVMSQASSPDQHDVWTPVEALIYAAYAVAPACRFTNSSSESHVAVEFVFVTCLRLPSTSVLLRETITKVFGTYSVFLRYNPQKLGPIISHALDTLVSAPTIAHVASNSILRITESCRTEMMFAGNRIFSVAKENTVRTEERLDLYHCLAIIMSSQTWEGAKAGLPGILSPSVMYLETVTVELDTPNPNIQIDNVVFALETLETIMKYGWLTARQQRQQQRFGSNNGQAEGVQVHPAAESFHMIFVRILGKITRRLSYSARVSERLAALFKMAIRAFGSHFGVYLQDFLSLMVEAFQISGMSPFLYAASIGMEEFSTDRTRYPFFVSVVESLSVHVFGLLPNLEAFTNNPDVVEDFFIMLDRVIRFMPTEIINAHFFPETFKCGVVGSLIEHRDASKCLLLYMESVMLFGVVTQKNAPVNGPLRPLIEACFQQYGNEFVANLMAGISGAIAETRVTSKSDGSFGMTLYAVGSFLDNLENAPKDGSHFRAIMQFGLTQPMCQHVSTDLQVWFLDEIMHAFMSRNVSQFEEVLCEFSYKARLRLRRDANCP